MEIALAPICIHCSMKHRYWYYTENKCRVWQHIGAFHARVVHFMSWSQCNFTLSLKIWSPSLSLGRTPDAGISHPLLHPHCNLSLYHPPCTCPSSTHICASDTRLGKTAIFCRLLYSACFIMYILNAVPRRSSPRVVMC